MKPIKPIKLIVAIGLTWLFHISGIIGIFMGFEEWFLPKTPLNLLLSFGLLVWIADLTSLRKTWFVYLFFIVGIFVEWLGVTYGFPFGTYHYGGNLGAKLDGVPYMIGINWAMLVIITGGISTRLTSSFWLRVISGALLMVFLDFFIEVNASKLDFWYWENDRIPVSNYLAWFVVAFGLNWIFQKYMEKPEFTFSLNLYLSQLAFFASLYFYG